MIIVREPGGWARQARVRKVEEMLARVTDMTQKIRKLSKTARIIRVESGRCQRDSEVGEDDE